MMPLDLMVAMMSKALSSALGEYMVPRRPNAKAKSGGWGMTSTLSAGRPLNPRGVNSELVLNVDFPKADMHTVQVGMVGPTNDPSAPASPYAAVAMVEWSVNGVTITRMFDVGQGAEISAPAEAIRVVIKDNTAIINQDGHPYKVFATVTPRTRPYSGQPLTLTAPAGHTPIPPSGSVPMPVPQNVGARSAMLYISPTVPGVAVSCVVQQNTVSSSTDVTAVASSTYTGPGPMALLNGVNQLVIHNVGVAEVQVSALWGIEG